MINAGMAIPPLVLLMHFMFLVHYCLCCWVENKIICNFKLAFLKILTLIFKTKASNPEIKMVTLITTSYNRTPGHS